MVVVVVAVGGGGGGVAYVDSPLTSIKAAITSFDWDNGSILSLPLSEEL